MFRRPVRALGDGAFAIALDAHERAVLRRLATELRELVEADDPAVARLFPPAYRDDADAAAEFDRLVREELTGGRVAALATLDRSAESELLTEEELEAWCGALNDVRLVLGEQLGVTEDVYPRDVDPREPQGRELALYGWLSWLQSEIVDVLAARLP